MNFLEKLGLLWIIYSIIYSFSTQTNAEFVLVLSFPGIIIFLIGNVYNFPFETDININEHANNPRICKNCGLENDIDFVYCSNCGHQK